MLYNLLVVSRMTGEAIQIIEVTEKVADVYYNSSVFQVVSRCEVSVTT